MRIASPNIVSTLVGIRLTRPTSGSYEDGAKVSLEIEDLNSSLLLGSISLDAEQFTDLMTNRLAKAEGEFYSHGLASVGKRRIAQSITINFTEEEGENISEREAVFSRKLEEIEKEYEGWRCNDRTFNYKYYDNNKRQYPMTLIKWVTPEELQEIKERKEDLDGL